MLSVRRWSRGSLLFGAALPFLLYLAWLETRLLSTHTFGGDFRPVRQAAADAIRWRSPYRPPTSATASRAVYPPPLFLALAPLTVVPHAVASAVWLVGLIASAALALRAVGVDDPKVYLTVALFPFLITGVWIGNPSPLLMLCFALIWRWRDQTSRVAAAIAAAAAIKLWPLIMVVWLFVTGRRRAALLAVAAALALVVVSWALIGFAGLSQYPQTLRTDVDQFAHLNAFVVGAVLALPL